MLELVAHLQKFVLQIIVRTWKYMKKIKKKYVKQQQMEYKNGFGFSKIENKQERIDEEMKIWKNKNTEEEVFQHSNMTNKIGLLEAFEECQAVKINDTCFLVYYKVNGKDFEKAGFVNFNGGIE